MSWIGRFIAIFLAGLRPATLAADEPPKEEVRTMLAMVALEDSKFPLAKQLSDYLNERWPSLGPFKPDADPVEESTISVSNPEGIMLVAMTMDLPIPEDDWRFPCQTNLGWENACSELGKMQGHVIVTTFSQRELSDAEQTLLVSAFAQAVSAQSKSIGVYVGQAASVWSAQQWEEAVLPASLEEPPYFPWMGIKAQGEEGGGITVVTMGMPIFGMLNIEIQNSKKNGLDASELVSNMANYLLTSRATIRDGDTVGFTAEQKVKITHDPSIVDPSATVFRLHF